MFRLTHKQMLFASSLALLALCLLGLQFPVSAAPELQITPFPTPTPGPDGRIIYIVKEGDTLWRVAAITGVSLDQLRELNDLGTDQPIVPGQELLIGYGGPAETTPTSGPSPTPEAQLPTPSPQPGSGTLCVLVFNDGNGDSLRQEDELSIPGGEISVNDRSGEVSQTASTNTGADPNCFEELSQGDYNVTVAIPDGYNPTTVLNYALKLEPGSETYLDFGAQPSSEKTVESEVPTGGSKSPILGILGVLILLIGIGLGVFAGRLGGKGDQSAQETRGSGS
jgi:murein DD-endopeptidase MepM/ murein hydrolase activator NlpD